MKGGGFLGLVLICGGILLAYLYRTGRWPQVWADITGAAPSSATPPPATNPSGDQTPSYSPNVTTPTTVTGGVFGTNVQPTPTNSAVPSLSLGNATAPSYESIAIPNAATYAPAAYPGLSYSLSGSGA